ncbi:MAG: MATE family efflux transporter [Hydrogenophaga sp.]|nr:MATE family efflux transporter [Hydrogenophaga sp.]
MRSLLRLAAPLVAGLALSTGVMLVDTAMLGPLGAIPLAAVSLTTSVIIIFWAALYGFAGPVGLYVGRAHGAMELPRIGHVARHGFVLALLAGTGGALLMAAALPLLPWIGQPAEVVAAIGPYWLCMSASLIPYTVTMAAKNLLDATERPWVGVLITTVPVALNVFLNWVLIYGNLGAPALGLTGAGIASVIAQTAGGVVICAYARCAPSVRAWWGAPQWERAEFGRLWREALPMTTQYFLEGAAVAVAGVLIGLFGTVALAGNQVALSVGATLYMLPLGMAAAVSIRVAQAVGAREQRRIAPIGFAGLGVVTVWMGAIALVFLTSGATIAAWFVDDAAVIAAAASIFFIYGLTQLADGVQSVSLGALRGLLDNAWPTRVSLIAYWLVALPLGALLGFGAGWGAPGVWAGFGVGLLGASVALLHRFMRQTRRNRPRPR